MPRQLTQALRQASHAAQTAACPILLVTIDHPSLLGAPIRLTSDNVHTLSRGELYVRIPFELTLPDDVEDRPPRAKISVANISREMIRFIEELPPGEAPKVLLELVMAGALDNVEEAWGPFRMTEPDYDARTLSAELAIDDRSQEPFGHERYTPDMFIALFAAV